MIQLPTTPGGFGCILADPPWTFKTYDQKKSIPTQAQDPYASMKLSDLMALPVPDVAAKDCFLAMWATWPCLPQAFQLMDAWGFTYKTGGAWAKQTSTGRKWQFGTGYIFRSASEVLLIGSRGKPKWLSKSERNLWVSPVREHSRKPDIVGDMLLRSCAGQHLELFARESRPGWVSWGAEADKFDAPGCVI